MKLSQFKTQLCQTDTLRFQLPNASFVPAHFHVTEVGVATKRFVDCGSVLHTEEVADFQLWEAADYDHRLSPEKLLDIIQFSERILKMGDLDVEVAYQTTTLGKYGLDHNGRHFVLTAKQTHCLAKEKCSAIEESKVKPSELSAPKPDRCTPASGCR